MVTERKSRASSLTKEGSYLASKSAYFTRASRAASEIRDSSYISSATLPRASYSSTTTGLSRRNTVSGRLPNSLGVMNNKSDYDNLLNSVSSRISQLEREKANLQRAYEMRQNAMSRFETEKDSIMRNIISLC